MSGLDFDAIWTVLVQECGAAEGDGMLGRAWFLAAQQHRPVTEYRFIGALGFGGKFWINDGRLYVTCYREDETPERLAMIERANRRLAELDGAR